MAELLIELLSEEIPARMQARAAADLGRLLSERLTAAGLVHEAPQVFATPRRLAVAIAGLPKKQPDVSEERRGPRLGAPEKAVQGFLKANGLKSVKQAEVRSLDKGEFYFAIRKTKGQTAAAVLPGLIGDSIRALGWPKSMRWTEGSFRWVRPLQSILAVFAGHTLTGEVPLGGDAALSFGNETAGHRFLAPKSFKVRNFADYEAKLRKAYVILDPEKRKAEILRQAKRRIARAKLKLKDDPALIDEVVGLVEWPVVLMGRIDERFMDLPAEVLTTTMRSHQKYLSLLGAKGRLSSSFLLVANMATADRGKTIVAGNERVLRARLADARFFWDQDRKHSLASRAPRLSEIVFHEKLGTLDEKVDRVQALATEIADYVPGADKDRVRSAARLAKADLVTGMVGEFPELQGIMGRYYALHDGEHEDVARAIAEHYSPLGPGDTCPSAPTSVAVALADKIDTLAGFFAIGEKPTGSKDPYALRRAALGIIRLISENRLRLPLRFVIDQANDLFANTIVQVEQRASPARGGSRTIWAGMASLDVLDWGQINPVTLGVLDFIADRLKVALRDQGIRHDLISAVFALGGEDDLVRLLARVGALETFLKTDDGANLLSAFKRANNIVQIEEKKDGTHYDGDDMEPVLLRDETEKTLNRALDKALEIVVEARDDERYEDACLAFAKLRSPVDHFFETVRVNTDDRELRQNRLRFLDKIRSRFLMLANFSKIEG